MQQTYFPTLSRTSGSAYLRYGKADKNQFPPATLDIAPPIYAVSATPTSSGQNRIKGREDSHLDRSFILCTSCKPEFWVIEQDGKHLPEDYFRLEKRRLNTTSALGSYQSFYFRNWHLGQYIYRHRRYTSVLDTDTPTRYLQTTFGIGT